MWYNDEEFKADKKLIYTSVQRNFIQSSFLCIMHWYIFSCDFVSFPFGWYYSVYLFDFEIWFRCFAVSLFRGTLNFMSVSDVFKVPTESNVIFKCSDLFVVEFRRVILFTMFSVNAFRFTVFCCENLFLIINMYLITLRANLNSVWFVHKFSKFENEQRQYLSYGTYDITKEIFFFLLLQLQW